MELQRGDYILAQQMTGKSYETVRSVAKGRRRNERVIEAFEKIMNNRERLITESQAN
jgi:hypothetical protein